MKQHTRLLHLTVIRLLKGVITAWEKWLSTEGQDPAKAPEDVKEVLKMLSPKQ